MSDGATWITGTGGLLGSHLVRAAARYAPRRRVLPLDRAALDLGNPEAVRRRFAADPPAAILHCAALSKTGPCEAQPALARAINVGATALLAELAAERPFFLLSTDLVFDGREGNYDESAHPRPLNTYAATKAEAEQVVLRNPRHTVIRTSLNAGVSPTGDRSFNEDMRRTLAAGRTLSLFTDEFRCPIPAAVTARALWELLELGATGLLHLAGPERLSRWEIGQQLAARWAGLPGRLEPGSLRDYTGPARAPDTSLNSARAQALLSFPLPAFSAWLRDNPGEPL
jgi:dTDP-4-dehydrorhamnose reductase